MGASYESNIDDVLAQLDELEFEDHTLKVANVMEYAVYLHDMEGYYVFNDQALKKIVQQKMIGLDAQERTTDEGIKSALDTAAGEYVAWLADFIGEKQPAVPEVKGGERPARRGHWADRTHNLASHYKSQVDDDSVRDHDDVAPDPTEDLDDQVLDFPS